MGFSLMSWGRKKALAVDQNLLDQPLLEGFGDEGSVNVGAVVPSNRVVSLDDYKPNRCAAGVRDCLYGARTKQKTFGVIAVAAVAIIIVAAAIGVPIGLRERADCEKQSWGTGIGINTTDQSVGYTVTGFNNNDYLLCASTATLSSVFYLLNATVSCFWKEIYSNSSGELFPGFNASCSTLLSSQYGPVPIGGIAQKFSLSCDGPAMIGMNSEFDLDVENCTPVPQPDPLFEGKQGYLRGLGHDGSFVMVRDDASSGTWGDLCDTGGTLNTRVSTQAFFEVSGIERDTGHELAVAT